MQLYDFQNLSIRFLNEFSDDEFAKHYQIWSATFGKFTAERERAYSVG